MTGAGPTLLEGLTTLGQLVRVEPYGVAAVTLIVQPLSGVSAEARAALRLPPGPGAALTWRSWSPLEHEQVGAVFLHPGQDVELTLFMAGLSQQQAHACAEALAGLISWSEEP